jgi:hypothetical protein
VAHLRTAARVIRFCGAVDCSPLSSTCSTSTSSSTSSDCDTRQCTPQYALKHARERSSESCARTPSPAPLPAASSAASLRVPSWSHASSWAAVVRHSRSRHCSCSRPPVSNPMPLSLHRPSALRWPPWVRAGCSLCERCTMRDELRPNTPEDGGAIRPLLGWNRLLVALLHLFDLVPVFVLVRLHNPSAQISSSHGRTHDDCSLLPTSGCLLCRDLDGRALGLGRGYRVALARTVHDRILGRRLVFLLINLCAL